MKQHNSPRQTGRRQAGFTIVELLIATLVFSVILLVLSAGLLQVTRVYYKGITTTRTQQTTRLIVDNIARSIQFSGGVVSAAPICPNGPTSPCYFCVNNDRYTYQINKQLVDGTPGTDQQNHVFIKDTTASCTAPADLATPPADATELMGVDMRLADLRLSPVGTNGVYAVSVRIVSGDSDLLCSPSASDCNSTTPSTHLTNNDISCKGFSGNQFCAAAKLDVTVQKRI